MSPLLSRAWQRLHAFALRSDGLIGTLFVSYGWLELSLVLLTVSIQYLYTVKQVLYSRVPTRGSHLRVREIAG